MTQSQKVLHMCKCSSRTVVMKTLLHEGELDQSMLSEYEERLELKRQEVSRLQQQRDKLLATQRKLQELQQNVSTVSKSHFMCAYSRNSTYGTK